MFICSGVFDNRWSNCIFVFILFGIKLRILILRGWIFWLVVLFMFMVKIFLFSSIFCVGNCLGIWIGIEGFSDKL